MDGAHLQKGVSIWGPIQRYGLIRGFTVTQIMYFSHRSLSLRNKHCVESWSQDTYVDIPLPY